MKPGDPRGGEGDGEGGWNTNPVCIQSPGCRGTPGTFFPASLSRVIRRSTRWQPLQVLPATALPHHAVPPPERGTTALCPGCSLRRSSRAAGPQCFIVYQTPRSKVSQPHPHAQQAPRRSPSDASTQRCSSQPVSKRACRLGGRGRGLGLAGMTQA